LQDEIKQEGQGEQISWIFGFCNWIWAFSLLSVAIFQLENRIWLVGG
jgi:hypothetical protein